jgi:hypothetical protein
MSSKDKTKTFLFFEKTTKKTKILSITSHFKHTIVLNIEIKEKKYRKITKIK